VAVGGTYRWPDSQTHPESCTGLILQHFHVETQGVALVLSREVASYLFWENYVKPIPPTERHDIIAAYYKRLTSPELQTRLEAARAWSI